MDQDEAESYANKNSMGFFEVSPLVNFNISETFVDLARMALKRNGMERLWRSNKGRGKIISNYTTRSLHTSLNNADLTLCSDQEQKFLI